MIREAVKGDATIARLRREFQAKFDKRAAQIQAEVWEKIRKEQMAAFKLSCKTLGIPLLPPVPKIDYDR